MVLMPRDESLMFAMSSSEAVLSDACCRCALTAFSVVSLRISECVATP